MTFSASRFLARLCALFLVSLSPGKRPASAANDSPVVIRNLASVPEPFVARLTAQANTARARFESSFGPVGGPLLLRLGGPGCLRTGYDFSSREVVFCDTDRVVRLGLESIDVINHEIFHALTCARLPQACTSDFLRDRANVALHEGMADFFAHELQPDDRFGEGFSREQPQGIRSYRTSLCWSLVEEPHAKGNALVSFLVNGKRTLKSLSGVFATGRFSLESVVGAATPADPCLRTLEPPRIDVTAEGVRTSSLGRYSLSTGVPLRLRFVSNAAVSARFPDLTIEWDLSIAPAPVPLDIRAVGAAVPSERAFAVTAGAGRGAQKRVARFISRGKVVGYRSFYFSVK